MNLVDPVVETMNDQAQSLCDYCLHGRFSHEWVEPSVEGATPPLGPCCEPDCYCRAYVYTERFGNVEFIVSKDMKASEIAVYGALLEGEFSHLNSKLRDAQVGAKMGISGRTYGRIRELYNVAHGHTDDRPDVVEIAQSELERVDRQTTSVRTASDKILMARAGRQLPVDYKGAHQARRQLRALESLRLQLSGIATALEFSFDGGFEKTCTPEKATEYAKKIKSDLSAIRKVVAQLEKYGKGI